MNDKAQDQFKYHHIELLNDIKRGRLIPVLGGDINLCGRPRREDGTFMGWQENGANYPPSTSELALYLLGEAIKDAENSNGVPLPKILKNLVGDKAKENPDAFMPIGLVNVCQYLYVRDNDFLRGKLNEQLNAEYDPTPVHDFLVNLATIKPDSSLMDPDAYPFPFIVTACFDNVLEKQLDAAKQLYHLVAFVGDTQGGKFVYTAPGSKKAEPMNPVVDAALKAEFKKYPLILKLNGGLSAGQGDFAITEDHYIDYLTHKNLTQTFPDILLAKLTKRGRSDGPHLLFLGYSPRNWNLRVILRRIWSELLSTTNKQWTFVQERRPDLDDQEFWNQYARSEFALGTKEVRSEPLEAYIRGLSERLLELGGSMRESGGSSSARKQGFDVFLSHNSKDKPEVEKLGDALKKRGLSVWLDKWELRPGGSWMDALEDIIATCKSAAVCVGKNGIGPWEQPEMKGLLMRFVDEKTLPVIPILLPGAPANVDLPTFLRMFTWVDLRGGMDEEGLDRVQWGVTGNNPKLADKQCEPAPKTLDAASRGQPEMLAMPFETPGPNQSTIEAPRNREGILFCYCAKEKKWLDELKTMLAPLKWKLIDWDIVNINPGDPWRDEIRQTLASVRAAVLLVSPDFIASELIQNNELPGLLTTAERESCKVLWINVVQSMVKYTGIKDFKPLYSELPLASLTGDPSPVLNAICEKLIEECGEAHSGP